MNEYRQTYCTFLSCRNCTIDKHDDVGFSFPLVSFHHFQLPIFPYDRCIIAFSLNLFSPGYLNEMLEFRRDIFDGKSLWNIGWETKYVEFVLENPFLLLLTINCKSLSCLNHWDSLLREYLAFTINLHLFFLHSLRLKEYKAWVSLVIHQPIIIIFNRNVSIPRHGLAPEILHFYFGLPIVFHTLVFLQRRCSHIFNLALQVVLPIFYFLLE